MERMNNRINESFKVHFELPKSTIIEFFKRGKQSQKLLDSILSDPIDFSEIILDSDNIEITRMPKATAPFRPYGKIIIEITAESIDKSLLKFEVRPFNNTFPIVLIIAIILMTTWSLIGSLFSSGENFWMLIITGWSMASIVLLINYKLFKIGLIKYTNIVVAEIKAAANKPPNWS